MFIKKELKDKLHIDYPAVEATKIIVQDEETGLWYFWDEHWINKIGPFSSEVEAYKALCKYAEEL